MTGANPAASTAQRAVRIPVEANQNRFLWIDVPAECSTEKKEGPDFDVYFFSRSPNARLGIYLGHAPRPRWPENARTTNQEIAGHGVIWYAWEENKGASTTYYREAIIDGLFDNRRLSKNPPPELPPKPPPPPPPPPVPPPPPSWVEDLSVHVFINGTDRQEVEVLWRSATSLRLTPR